MEQDIYLDVYFSFNFLMDFFVLFLTGIIIKNNKKIYRTIVSAIIGATYATIVMITEGMEIYQKSIGIFQKGIGEDLTKPLKIVLTYVVIVYVMELIAYGKYNAVTMTRNMIIIYIITFILSGAVNAYYWENRVDGINVTKTILLVFFIEIFLVVLVKRSQKDVSITSLYQVTLLVDGNRINVIGLADTGNSLTEPITGKPVSVIQAEELKKIPDKILLVPYNSVGKERGLMRAFVADNMIVNGRTVEKPIIGIHKGSFGGNNQYQLILHPKILKGESGMLINREMNTNEMKFSFLQGMIIKREGGIHYIGGNDILPAPLSTDKEGECIKNLIENNDEEAKSMLIEHNLRLVVYIAKKFDNTGVGVEDLISIGTIGLIKGINTFKPDKNIKLATYASRCIENEILMYLRKNNKTKLEVSIDEPLNVDWDGNELLLSDILGTDEDVISKGIESEVEKKLLYKAIEKLNHREKVIVEMRYGLNNKDGEEMTQKEVADSLGISQSYISRLEKKIIKRLKREILKFE